MVEQCRWSDKFVELQLWTHLTSLAYDQRAHNLVIRCSKKALRFASSGTQPKNKKVDGWVNLCWSSAYLFLKYIQKDDITFIDVLVHYEHFHPLKVARNLSKISDY